MLKIGAVRWRGKCSRHPMFDPYVDGPGAVKAGCTRCQALVEINTLHQRMLVLMKNFAPPQPARKQKPETESLQESLF